MVRVPNPYRVTNGQIIARYENEVLGIKIG
jgi:hypothetical protein